MKLILESWRKYLKEDLKRRQDLARDLEDTGVKDNWVDDPSRLGDDDRQAAMKKITSQGRDLKPETKRRGLFFETFKFIVHC